jgi:hypothetical protein
LLARSVLKGIRHLRLVGVELGKLLLLCRSRQVGRGPAVNSAAIVLLPLLGISHGRLVGGEIGKVGLHRLSR